MKKKIILLAIASIMAVGTIIGGTMAAYQASTDTRKTISTSSVDVGLEFEGVDVDDSGTLVYTSSDVEDGTVEEKVRAVNKGERDIYVRVSVNKAWYDENGKVFENEGKELNSNYIGIRTANESDWIIQDEDIQEGGNGEVIYLYYKRPLAAKASTSALMDAFTLLKDVNENTNHYSGLQAKIRFDADAVQITAGHDAMLAEWGVDVEIDPSGTIIRVTNQ